MPELENKQETKSKNIKNIVKSNKVEQEVIHNSKPKPRNDILISVVIPLLNEEESIPELTTLLVKELNILCGNRYEVIYIDDGSTDNSFYVINSIYEKNRRIKCIRFRRNYGKSAALSVGFGRVRGKYVITVDADLQDDPSEIKNLISKLEEGYDLVSGWKKVRYDPISKTLPSKLFNWVTSKAAGIKLHDFNCGLKGYRAEVVKIGRAHV